MTVNTLSVHEQGTNDRLRYGWRRSHGSILDTGQIFVFSKAP